MYRSFEALTDNEELYDAMWKPEGDETPNEAFERNCIIVSNVVYLYVVLPTFISSKSLLSKLEATTRICSSYVSPTSSPRSTATLCHLWKDSTEPHVGSTTP